MNEEEKQIVVPTHSERARYWVKWSTMLLALMVVVLWWHRWSFEVIANHLDGRSLSQIESKLDFGELSESQVNVLETTILNSGFSKLRIVGTHQSCQCAHVQEGFLPVEIGPRQMIRLPVVFHVKKMKKGPTVERILLLTDRRNMTLPIEVVANIVDRK